MHDFSESRFLCLICKIPPQSSRPHPLQQCGRSSCRNPNTAAFKRTCWPRQLTGYSEKSGRFRCLLVTARRRQDGILVDSEGYAYARYAAYVRDKRELDLAGVPRDNLDFKAHER